MSIPKSVAKISPETASSLNIQPFYDADNNVVVDLDFGSILDVSEFQAIPYVASTQSLNDGIIPPKRHTP